MPSKTAPPKANPSNNVTNTPAETVDDEFQDDNNPYIMKTIPGVNYTMQNTSRFNAGLKANGVTVAMRRMKG